MNDLTPVRDYCYVEDIASAVLHACAVPANGIETINLGSGTGISVGDFAHTVIRVVGRNIPIRQKQILERPAQSEIYRLVADCTRANAILAWKPVVTLEDGIRRCL